MEFAFKDLVMGIGALAAVFGSHFMLRGRVMVLESLMQTHREQFREIKNSLVRIEQLLGQKADR